MCPWIQNFFLRKWAEWPANRQTNVDLPHVCHECREIGWPQEQAGKTRCWAAFRPCGQWESWGGSLHEHLSEVLLLLALLLDGERKGHGHPSKGSRAATSQLRLKQPGFPLGPWLFPGSDEDKDVPMQPSPHHHLRNAKQREAVTKNHKPLKFVPVGH